MASESSILFQNYIKLEGSNRCKVNIRGKKYLEQPEETIMIV